MTETANGTVAETYTLRADKQHGWLRIPDNSSDCARSARHRCRSGAHRKATPPLVTDKESDVCWTPHRCDTFFWRTKEDTAPGDAFMGHLSLLCTTLQVKDMARNEWVSGSATDNRRIRINSDDRWRTPTCREHVKCEAQTSKLHLNSNPGPLNCEVAVLPVGFCHVLFHVCFLSLVPCYVFTVSFCVLKLFCVILCLHYLTTS